MRDIVNIDGRPLEWSGRHIRLKYQMVIACLVFFSVTKYGFEEFKLIPFKLSEQPDLKLVIVGTGVFALFSIISFIFRTINENASKSGVSINVLGEFKNAIESVYKLQQDIREISVPNYQGLETRLGVLKNSLMSSKKIISDVEALPISYLTKIKLPANDKIEFYDTELTKLIAITSPSDEYEYEVIGRHKSVVEAIQKLKEVKTVVVDLSEYVTGAKNSADDATKTLVKFETYYKETMQSDIVEVLENLEKGNQALTKIQSRFSSLNGIHLFERSGLSIWIPVGVSLFLFLIALQGAVPKLFHPIV